jgi:hypothetical protein
MAHTCCCSSHVSSTTGIEKIVPCLARSYLCVFFIRHLRLLVLAREPKMLNNCYVVQTAAGMHSMT